jgi:isopentenyl-diphosphate delta-isomerase
VKGTPEISRQAALETEAPMVDERLILVDESNRAIGTAGKTAVHRKGLLHRAFSIFVVDERGRIVLQQRNPKKYHSGGLWANSCCGHPRPGERTLAAARRRLHEELGVSSPLSFGFFARYRTALDNGMQENEFVYVYFGPLASQPRPDYAEVSKVDFVDPGEINRRIQQQPNLFTVWLRHYFQNHFSDIRRLANQAARSS